MARPRVEVFPDRSAEGVGRKVGEKVGRLGSRIKARIKVSKSKIDTPNTNPGKFRKQRGNQGYKDKKGNTWKKDNLHKDHWDVTNRSGKKIQEVDFNGNELWPNGPKNTMKKPK